MNDELDPLGSVCGPSPPAESVSVASSATGAPAEAIAAQDVEDDIKYGDDDLDSKRT